MSMCESFEKEYQLCEEIGRGRFGVVYRCFSPASNTSFAVKSIDKRPLNVHDSASCLDAESKLLLLLPPHPNIIRIHSLYDSDSHLHIVTDLCESSDLHDSQNSSAPFSEPDACSVLSQLVSALSHCHRHGVVHRDVKPENVLFDTRGSLMLCDFGLARKFVNPHGERVPIRGKVGTPYYVAPEVLNGSDYDEKVDVWSASVILYMLLGGVLPFSGQSTAETLREVLRADLRFPSGVFASVSTEAKDLIRKMLCMNVSTRLTADQVLRHPWVVSGRRSARSSIPTTQSAHLPGSFLGRLMGT